MNRPYISLLFAAVLFLLVGGTQHFFTALHRRLVEGLALPQSPQGARALELLLELLQRLINGLVFFTGMISMVFFSMGAQI